MTEAEWKTCCDVERMLQCFSYYSYRTELELFGCACCRRVWSFVEDQRSRIGVETRERYLRGLASDKELNDAKQNARIARNEIRASIIHLSVEEWSPKCAPGWAAGAAANAATGNFSAASDFAARTSACAADGNWQESYNSERAAQCELLRSMVAYPGLCLRISPRTMLVATALASLTLLAAYLGWRQYNLNWIKQRHEAENWLWPEGTGKISALTGIGGSPTDRLPWSLKYWGETRAFAFLNIELNDLPDKDRPRAYRLKELFPEAEVSLQTDPPRTHPEQFKSI